MFQDDDINRIQNYEAHPLQEVEYDIDKAHVYSIWRQRDTCECEECVSPEFTKRRIQGLNFLQNITKALNF